MEDETIWESISIHRTSCKIVNSWRDISKLLQNSVDPLDLPPLLGHLSIEKFESKQRMLRPIEPQKTAEYEVMGHTDGSYILTKNFWENPILKGVAFDFDKSGGSESLPRCLGTVELKVKIKKHHCWLVRLKQVNEVHIMTVSIWYIYINMHSI